MATRWAGSIADVHFEEGSGIHQQLTPLLAGQTGGFMPESDPFADMQVKSRHHLRSDEVREIETALETTVGVELDADTYELVELEGTEFDLVLVDGEPVVVYVGDEPFLTVQGANAYPPTDAVVTVDAGAVSFVSSGADVMRPGIVEADGDIESGDLVAIAEETHGKVLAIGRAKTTGDDMVGDSGKVVESVHHVGDDLFEFSV
ncbi:RNA-binding protein [Halobacterium noricense]|uniref:RNA-binding protein n=2 Tax=Haladaptatus pallidirubidus TaxID=1008152 RepID=A0AAV3ULV2_9EURY